MQIGYIRVELESSMEALPIIAARVIVELPNGETVEQVTDASGETVEIPVECPDAELSLIEGYTGDVYSVCNVLVRSNKYIAVHITGVQVFAGQTAIVPIAMEPKPISPGEDPNLITQFDIPPNTVSNVHQNLDPPPQLLGNVGVLNAAVVPETITVHLGTPTSSATNVTVRFPDYIKNVCCSEIFSTWPDAAVRANIYCQISLALNRIFTEWYRSRGYAFDITNSTQYDQYYVHGRQIASNVSRIVDEIYTEYVRRNNNVEPFYTEYCNGTTVTCPGLKQWGTVTLAQQGYTPIQILRYYYGNSVNIATAQIVKGVPVSYPGTPLQQGSTGASVTTIQTWLSRVRQNYPLIPTLPVDGNFGTGTRAAVIVFQKIFNLTQDGIVGKATWNKLSYIYVAVTKLAELGSEGIVGPAIQPETSTDTIRRGATGDLVTMAQFMLNITADFYEQLQTVGVDGVFGANTETAVRQFQMARGITADGVIGPVTWENLYDVYYDVFNAKTPVNPVFPGTNLTVGSSGSNVNLMQTYLNYIGNSFTAIPVLTIDSKFGNATRAAVIAFQNTFGLTADGIIGTDTWTAIVRTYNTLASTAAL